MADTSRRQALKAALTDVAFVPVAATVVQAADKKPPEQAERDGGEKKHPTSRKGTPPPNARMAKQPRRETKARFHASQQPPGSNQPPSDEEVNAFRAKLDQLKLALDAIEPLTARLPDRRIEARFAYAGATTDFSAIRCDALAMEASTLIARCMQLRKEWEGVYETSYAFLTDIDRFYKLDAIFQLEEANGVYDLDYAASQGDLAAAAAAQFPLANAAAAVKASYDTLNATYSDQYGWIQLLGWLSHISGYGQSGKATAAVVWNGVQDTVIDYCYKAAVAQGQTQLDNQSNQLFSDYQVKSAQAEAISSRISALQSRAGWDLKNQQFRKMRVQAIRDLYTQKQQMANQPSGPLHYTERLARLQDVFDATFSDALARFTAISSGFAMIFGYSIPVPAEVVTAIQNPGVPQPSNSVLDVAGNWLDTIGRWYAHFLPHEQTYSLCLSVRDAVSQDSWHNFLASGTLLVTVPEELFPEQYYVRCRAVGMYTVGMHGFCSARLKLPSSSYFIHKDLTKSSVDQSAIPLQRISRAMPAESSKPTERVGMNTLLNCSPIGKWEISLSEKSSNGGKRSHLDDLLLEIIVVEQS